MDASLAISLISLVIAGLVALSQWRHRNRQEIREVQRDERKVGILIKNGGIPMGDPRDDYWRTVEVRVINEGYRPIQIQQVDLLDGDDKRLFLDEFDDAPSGIPKVLADGAAATVHFWRDTDAWQLRGKGERVRAAWVEDAYGGIWTEPVPPSVLENLP